MPTVIATSFADPNDLAAYRKAIREGKTPAEAKKLGDDGEGYWGDDTTSADKPMCALPREDWMSRWKSKAAARGQLVDVTYKGKTVTGELRDTLPRRANIKNGAGIDLNPGFAARFGLTAPFRLEGVVWAWHVSDDDL